MVSCQGCQKEFRSFITWSHIRVCTGLSLRGYKQKFGDNSLVDPGYRRRVARNSARRWRKLSREQKRLIGERISKSQRALPKGFRRRWLASRLQGFRRWLGEKTEAEKRKLYAEHSKKISQWWARLTVAEKKAIVAKRNFWGKLSSVAREAYLSRTLNRPDVRKRSAQAKRDWWNNLSVMERSSFLKRHLISKTARRKSIATRKLAWDGLTDDERLQFSLKRKAVWAALPESVKKRCAKAVSERMKGEWSRRGVNERRKALRRLLARRGMTKGEKALARVFNAYPEIRYTGNGAFWVTAKDGVHLNPDFVVGPFRRTRQVIEYFGFTGHKSPTFEKMQRYKECKISCLALFPEDLNHLSATKVKLAEFLQRSRNVALCE